MRSKREPGIRSSDCNTHILIYTEIQIHKYKYTNTNSDSVHKRLASGETAALGEILGRYWHLIDLAAVAASDYSY